MAEHERELIQFKIDEVQRAILAGARELEELEARRQEIENRLRIYRLLLSSRGVPPYPENPDRLAGESAAAHAARVLFPLTRRPTITDLARKILHGHPEGLTARAILDALRLSGAPVTDSPSALASLTTMMRRDVRFMRRHTADGFVYTLDFTKIPSGAP